MYIRYKQEIKQKNTPEDVNSIDFLVKRDKQNLRYNVKYKISDALKLRNRIELVKYHIGDEKPENGYLIFQDIIYKSLKSPISVTLRYALFDSDTYNSRIYTYEQDVLYAYSIRSFSGKGTRTYLMLRYKVAHGIDVWLRYSQTYFSRTGSVTSFSGVDIIGSSLNQIQGNTISEIKAQVRFKF